jgi:hypothetical protein
VFSSSRGLRGGSFDDPSLDLLASRRDSNDPSVEFSAVGFRVASIPEPASIMLCVTGVVMLVLRRVSK